MIIGYLCSNGKARSVEMWEEDPTVIYTHISQDPEEQYPFPDRPIAMICKKEGSEYDDTWNLENIGPAYGPLLFVHANPLSDIYVSLSDEELKFLENTVRLIEKGVPL